MPIYMDLHIVPGVKAKEAAEAHRMDILIEEEHACKCMTYWIDEARGHVFCLIDAPDMKSVETMHDKAHGLVPHKIIEVQTSLVESFLGRVKDPIHSAITDNGLPLISDPSFRILLIAGLDEEILLKHRFGDDSAKTILQDFNMLVRKQLLLHGGNEAEHSSSRYIISFTSAGKAFSCAMEIQKGVAGFSLADSGFRISLSAGEPVSGDPHLFGEVIRQAEQLCFISGDERVGISPSVKELLGNQELIGEWVYSINPSDQQWLSSLFDLMEQNYPDTGFGLDTFCRGMAVSRSQLYRRTLAITGFSPNDLLKEYRLSKAKELFKKVAGNVAEICFDTGFTSPSYFSKCFRTRFGISPLAFQKSMTQA